MNKKGQTLILFIILIPIIFTMLAIVVDVGLLSNQYQKTRGVIDEGISAYFSSYDVEDVKKILLLNEIPTENLEVEEKENQIRVSLSYKMDSLFGKIIRIQDYLIEIKRVGTKMDGKVKIEKE